MVLAWALVLAAAGFQPRSADRPSANLAMRDVVGGLVKAFAAGFPSCGSQQAFARAGEDARFLEQRLKSPAVSGAPWRMPPQYADSLRDDYDLLAGAAPRGTSVCEIAGLVAEDLHIKRLDCERFGAARLVPVVIVTRKGDKVENGWQVFSRWVPRSKLRVLKLPLPLISSPAKCELHPGLYEFRAIKGAVSVTHGPYAIGGDREFRVELPVE